MYLSLINILSYEFRAALQVIYMTIIETITSEFVNSLRHVIQESEDKLSRKITIGKLSTRISHKSFDRGSRLKFKCSEAKKALVPLLWTKQQQ